jgi:predicted phosphodiesterase
MSKIIFIGDIHGLDSWKHIVETHPTATTIVFEGDYLDSFNIDGFTQLQNLQDIVNFKKTSQQNVVLLVGNHDIHYWPGFLYRGTTSGYQQIMSHQYINFFQENIEHFQMAFVTENYLCTHAGVSAQFLHDYGYTEGECVVEFLNSLFHYKPNAFSFDAFSDRYEGYVDPYGDSVGQSPVWIRPLSLQRGNKKSFLKEKYIQIVGHTQQKYLDLNGKTTGGKYIYIDTLPIGEYLISEDGVLSVGTTTKYSKL